MTPSGRPHRRSLKDCLRTILPRRRVGQVDNPDNPTVGSGILQRKDPSLVLLPTFGSLSTLPDFESSRFDLDLYSASISDRSNSVVTRIWASDQSQHVNIPDLRSISELSQHEIYEAYQYQSDLGQLAKACGSEQDRCRSRNARSITEVSVDGVNISSGRIFSSQTSLLPRTSLSQLVTPDSLHFQSPLSRLAHACKVPSIYHHGTSQQASLASIRYPSPCASTLKLQRSTQSLRTAQETNQSRQSRTLESPISVTDSLESSNRRPLSRSHSSRSLSQDAVQSAARSKPSRRSEKASELEAGLSSINHFSSFCVLDAASQGCPVTATSQDLRYVFEIGEEFCLNTAGVDGADMDTVTGQDANGNAVIHLVVYSPLINPSSGRSRFVLASLLDITLFITDATSVPDLETISEESIIGADVNTPPEIRMQHSRDQMWQVEENLCTISPSIKNWSQSNSSTKSRYELSAEDLLGGCILPDRNPVTPTQAHNDDIWLDIASEESRRSRSMNSTPSTPRTSSTSTSISAQSMDNILDNFIASLQQLYSAFFLLGKSPLDENSYEICNVSPEVHASREYIEGHLSKTSAEDKVSLEDKLAGDKHFRMRVKWGKSGEAKQLYCVPLFGRSNITWVCFLVEEGRWPGLPMWNDPEEQ